MRLRPGQGRGETFCPGERRLRLGHDGGMKLLTGLVVSSMLVLVASCEDAVATLQDIEKTAEQAHATATEINARSEQIQQAVNDPVGTLRGVVTADLTRTPTDQPGVYVLTDLQTGCQFLATYAADQTTVNSIAPRVERAGDGTPRQRCVPIPGGADAQPEAEG